MEVKKRNIRGKLKLQGILHLLKQKIFLSNTLIVGLICFINQSQNDVPNFFLRVCAVLLIKMEKNNDIPNFGMCPRKNEVDDIVIFEMILIQNHDISVIFYSDE